MTGFKTADVTRRQTLVQIASATGASVGIVSSSNAEEVRNNGPVAVLDPGACILTPRAVEGPFYFDPHLERADIREGREGVPLSLALRVVEASNCRPVAGARVDVWHADALGIYSGYDRQSDSGNLSTKGMKFLRGTQFVDGGGAATFQSIYPGWYRGRTTHIHFKIFLDGKSMVTGQIYFPDALSQFIYENIAPYNTRKAARDTVNVTDGVLKESGGDHITFCSVKEETDQYRASLLIGINRDLPMPEMDMRGPPPPGMGVPPPGPPPMVAPVQRSQFVPPVKK